MANSPHHCILPGLVVLLDHNDGGVDLPATGEDKLGHKVLILFISLPPLQPLFRLCSFCEDNVAQILAELCGRLRIQQADRLNI